MTEYKEHSSGFKYPSLYVGLLYNVVKGVIFAVVGWFLIILLSYYAIGTYYITPEMKTERRSDYINELQSFINENWVDSESTGKITAWVRENPYVYLIVYYNLDQAQLPKDTQNVINNPSEFIGARIDEDIDHDELVRTAAAGGYHEIKLVSGGSLSVAIAEYTENFYYATYNIISIIVAGLIFILALVRYIRVIIERIKRFESDVTIVSEIDMGYEIVSEGADEISNLSGKVEQMRQSMLHHIKSEQEARETNAELITSLSHDIRTPLTVLMGYIEMMKEHEQCDEVMEGYVLATENTALRLKQLADDMFKYSLAFGDAEKTVKLEEYDAKTLIEQLFSEHFLLMREIGYDVRVEQLDLVIKDGSTVRTDAPNLMRIVDNVFSNLRKYADINHPIYFNISALDGRLIFECINTVRTDTEETESNGIGLKTCVRLASLVARKFEYSQEGDQFICRLIIDIQESAEK